MGKKEREKEQYLKKDDQSSLLFQRQKKKRKTKRKSYNLTSLPSLTPFDINIIPKNKMVGVQFSFCWERKGKRRRKNKLTKFIYLFIFQL